MRSVREINSQSGITRVKDITLISTSGVTVNEYEELPGKVTNSDIAQAQMARGIGDVARTLKELSNSPNDESKWEEIRASISSLNTAVIELAEKVNILMEKSANDESTQE